MINDGQAVRAGGGLLTIGSMNMETALVIAGLERVEKGSTVSTEDLISYGLLTPDGFKHGLVKHSEQDWAHYDYRLRDVVSTNSVENFWRLFKHPVRSTHTSISKQHMPKYPAEFTFRTNQRVRGNAMLDVILRAM